MMAFGIAFLEIHLHNAHREVDRCRAAPLGSKDAARHLPASTEEAPQPTDARCPTDPFWHSCPCVERLDACSMKPKNGPIVMLVPPVLHGNWKREWAKLTSARETKALKVELIHIHTTADKKDALYAYKSDAHWRNLVTNEDNKPWYRQERNIVLTSAHTWMSRIRNSLLCEEDTDRWGKKMQSLIFCPGWIIRDEFTTDKAVTARTCQIMLDLNKRYRASNPLRSSCQVRHSVPHQQTSYAS